MFKPRPFLIRKQHALSSGTPLKPNFIFFFYPFSGKRLIIAELSFHVASTQQICFLMCKEHYSLTGLLVWSFTLSVLLLFSSVYTHS